MEILAKFTGCEKRLAEERGRKNRVNRAKITKLSEVHWENIVKVQNCPEIGEGEVKKTSQNKKTYNWKTSNPKI